MLSSRPKLIACQVVILSLAGVAVAAPPDPPPAEVTRVPVELRLSVADLEKQVLRGIVQKIDPKAKPELPIVVKGNARDLLAKASDKPAAKEPETEQPKPKVVVLPAPAQPPVQPVVQPGRPRLLGRPIGSRIVERAVIQPAVDMFLKLLTDLPDLDYRIELRSFKLAISGQTLTCEVGGGFHADRKPPPGQPSNPTPEVRGDIGIKLTVTKELAWSESGKLELKEGTSRVWIDPDAQPVGFPGFDVARVLKLNGLLTLFDGVVDRQVMKQLTGKAMPDLAKFAPTATDKLPFVALAEITAYPLRSDGKDLYIPLVVGLVPSTTKTDGDAKIVTKTGVPPEPKVRGQIVFDDAGKPTVKLDPVR